jgi:hypothetical protein
VRDASKSRNAFTDNSKVSVIVTRQPAAAAQDRPEEREHGIPGAREISNPPERRRRESNPGSAGDDQRRTDAIRCEDRRNRDYRRVLHPNCEARPKAETHGPRPCAPCRENQGIDHDQNGEHDEVIGGRNASDPGRVPAGDQESRCGPAVPSGPEPLGEAHEFDQRYDERHPVETGSGLGATCSDRQEKHGLCRKGKVAEEVVRHGRKAPVDEPAPRQADVVHERVVEIGRSEPQRCAREHPEPVARYSREAPGTRRSRNKPNGGRREPDRDARSRREDLRCQGDQPPERGPAANPAVAVRPAAE